MNNQNPQRDQNAEHQAAPQARRPEAVDNVAPQEKAQVPLQEDRPMSEATRFDGPRSAPSRESQATTTAPKVASGMFLPVGIILVVAIVLIIVLVL